MHRSYILLVVAVVVIGLTAAFHFKASDTKMVEPLTKSFELVVKDKKLISGPSIVSVHQNDRVSITITVDNDEELHLHGYDLHIDLENGKPGTLTFVASSSGRYPYELEHTSTEIGELEVHP